MIRANEEWRNDPARRQSAIELDAARIAAAAVARIHLQIAYDALAAVPETGTSGMDGMVTSLRRKTWSALQAAQDIRPEPANECAIGNMAAFGEGMGG